MGFALQFTAYRAEDSLVWWEPWPSVSVGGDYLSPTERLGLYRTIQATWPSELDGGPRVQGASQERPWDRSTSSRRFLGDHWPVVRRWLATEPPGPGPGSPAFSRPLRSSARDSFRDVREEETATRTIDARRQDGKPVNLPARAPDPYDHPTVNPKKPVKHASDVGWTCDGLRGRLVFQL